MRKEKDDLEAVRTVVGVLQPFDAALQRRIVRWAAEKLDLPLPYAPEAIAEVPLRRRAAPPVRKRHARVAVPAGSGLKTFVAAKHPRSDTEFAATLAYHAQSVAPAGQRKAGINAADLVAACAEVGRKRPPVPGQTLRNARSAGVLASKHPGTFSVSPAGEKLVLRALPRAAHVAASPARGRQRKPGVAPRKKTTRSRRGRRKGAQKH
jgi:hypothetical protein